jgi:DNA-binding NtrC family response regulator
VPRKANLLLIDDDPNTLASLARAFRLAGHEATVCDSALRAADLIRSQHFDLILSDVVMPGKSGLELLEELKKAGVRTPIVLISGQANIEMAVKATRLGALDFLEKPLTTDKLLVTVENALRLTRLEDENRELRHRLGKHELVGSGPAMQKLLAQIDRVAASETRVCILGETGTGKELVARAIHENLRATKTPSSHSIAPPFPELIESELFGHEKGAFTGAAGRHVGKFEQAEGGTLFLDEIGDMPVAMQAKLLRVLEEGEVERVGGDKPIKVSVRVIVATHRNLEDRVRNNEFRRDLFHRIYVFPLTLPSLRDRLEDFPELIAHFAHQVAKQNGWKDKSFSDDAIAELRRYCWPGNVRELRNIVERLALLAAEDTITDEDVRLALPAADSAAIDSASAAKAATEQGTLVQRTEAFEREVLLAEIRRHNFHMTNVARALGLERSHLYKKCQQLGIDLQSLRKPE